MTNKLKMIAAATNDAAAERDGVWVEYCRPNGEGVIDTFRVLLSRAGSTNAPFQKLGNELTKKYRQSGTDIDKIDHETQRKISRELYAKAVVKSWNADDFGTEFTPEECISTFEADNDFLEFCITEATKASTFRKEVVKAETGNS